MLDKFRSVLIGVSLFVIAALGGFYLYVQAGGGESLLGSKEGTLVATDFSTLEYPNNYNGYLLCSNDDCPVANSDDNSPVFDLNVSGLRQLIADYADSYKAIKTRSFDFRINQFEFTEKLPGQTFPTVISVKIVQETPYTSKLIIYAYKPVGSSAKNAQKETVERWISLLQTKAPS